VRVVLLPSVTASRLYQYIPLVEVDDNHDGRAIGKDFGKTEFKPIGFHGSGWRCSSDQATRIVHVVFF